jgi:tetratricopeptide (TPR) repeat protein
MNGAFPPNAPHACYIAHAMTESADKERDAAHWTAVEEATELLNEERYVECLSMLKAVLQKDPQNPYAFFYTGVALYECGELEPARDAYRACLRVAPKHLGARIAVSHVLRQLGDHREAIKEGLIALEHAPNDAEALHAVGMGYYARGDNGPARKYLLAFLAAKPEFEVRVEVEALLERMELELPN